MYILLSFHFFKPSIPGCRRCLNLADSDRNEQSRCIRESLVSEIEVAYQYSKLFLRLHPFVCAAGWRLWHCCDCTSGALTYVSKPLDFISLSLLPTGVACGVCPIDATLSVLEPFEAILPHLLEQVFSVHIITTAYVRQQIRFSWRAIASGFALFSTIILLACCVRECGAYSSLGNLMQEAAHLCYTHAFGNIANCGKGDAKTLEKFPDSDVVWFNSRWRYRGFLDWDINLFCLCACVCFVYLCRIPTFLNPVLVRRGAAWRLDTIHVYSCVALSL